MIVASPLKGELAILLFVYYALKFLDNRSKRPLGGLPKDKFYLFFGGALQNAVIARH